MRIIINYLKNIGKDPKDVRVHPKYNLPIEYKHTIDGVHYYQLSNDYEMFENRFRYLRTYYAQLEMKFTSKELSSFMDEIIKSCESGKLTKVYDIAKEVKYRSEWLFEPESLYQLYSVIVFDLQEDIRDFDINYNKKKIEAFKKKGLLKEILSKLLTNAETLLNLSHQDFLNYTKIMEENLKKQRELISQDTP